VVCVQERLEREYNIDLVTTSPSVVYKCINMLGEELVISSPGDLPIAEQRQSMSEPYVR
jgi:GTP-binding protein LepA